MIEPLLDTVAMFLALVLLVSAVHKASDLTRAAAAASRMVGLETPLKSLAVLALFAELTLGLGLLLVDARHLAALGAALLWVCYAGLVYRLSATGGGAFDCGCTLSRTKSSNSLQWLVAASLAVLALIVAFAPATQLVSFVTVLGAVAFLALYIAIGELMASANINREAV